MRWIAFLSMLGSPVAAAVSEYRLAVQTPNGELVNWGSLQLDPTAPRDFTYFPESDDVGQLSQGCLGILEGSKFSCRTLFNHENEILEKSTVEVHLNRDGSLLQLQFTNGPRDSLAIKLPDSVPRPVLKPPMRSGPAAKGAGSTSKPTPEDIAEFGEEAPEQSFIQKYWIYLIPIALIFVSNSMGAGAAGQQQQQASD